MVAHAYPETDGAVTVTTLEMSPLPPPPCLHFWGGESEKKELFGRGRGAYGVHFNPETERGE